MTSEVNNTYCLCCKKITVHKMLNSPVKINKNYVVNLCFECVNVKCDKILTFHCNVCKILMYINKNILYMSGTSVSPVCHNCDVKYGNKIKKNDICDNCNKFDSLNIYYLDPNANGYISVCDSCSDTHKMINLIY